MMSGGGGGVVAKGSKQLGAANLGGSCSDEVVDAPSAAAAAANKPLSSPAQLAATGKASSTDVAASPRLVFGLSSRTNKAKHDEYAAERRSNTPIATTSKTQREETSTTTKQAEPLGEASSSSSYSALIKHNNNITSQSKQKHSQAVSEKHHHHQQQQQQEQLVQQDTRNQSKVFGLVAHKKQQPQQQHTGNRQEVAVAATSYRNQSATETRRKANLGSSGPGSTNSGSVDSFSRAESCFGGAMNQYGAAIAGTNGAEKAESRVTSSPQQQQQQQQQQQLSTTRQRARSPQPQSASTLTSSSVGGDSSSSSSSSSIAGRRSRRKSLDGSELMQASNLMMRDKDVMMKDNEGGGVEKPSSIRSKPMSNNNNTKKKELVEEDERGKNQVRGQAKMQFTIPPPPQVSSLLNTATNKSSNSMVSMAKSKIYDKPTAAALRQQQQQKQQQQQQQQHLLMLNSFISPTSSHHQLSPLLDSSAPIPESILSGFKPPKQINVSKAREKWEGGEPFAKSKSRQRLAAAQAGKATKMALYNSWSTNVVATQQLQFQQALANSSAPIRSQVERQDPSMKILTRGSVLERVQQFEKAPSSTTIGNSLSNSSSTSSFTSSSGSSSSGSGSISGGDTSDFGEQDFDPKPDVTLRQVDNLVERVVSEVQEGEDVVHRSSSEATTCSDEFPQSKVSKTQTSLVDDQSQSVVVSPATNSGKQQFGTIKQAIYKARLSGVQNNQTTSLPHQQQQQDHAQISVKEAYNLDTNSILNKSNDSSTTTSIKNNASSSSPTKSSTISSISSSNSSTPAPLVKTIGVIDQQQQQQQQQRRLSLRRRSSTSSTINSNSSQIIPKFYHPYGKPNTYEIELQKKNIVACFDKFTDRKALLTAPGYRRHFHSVALACGFSEYFKEPLYCYVKHQMINSNLLHNNSAGLRTSITRKQSGLGPTMINNFTSQVPSSTITSGIANNLTNGTTQTTQSSLTSQVRKPDSNLPQNSTNTNNNTQIPNRAPLTKAASIDNSTMEKFQNQTYITCDQFLVCWRQIISSSFDLPARFIHLLTLGQRSYLLPEDFVPLIQSIIDDHPGLKFLRAAPDFHMRYIQTVIARIYYCINKSWTGKISINELRKSNLLRVLQKLSQEEDINQITDYFSYEHFYVIYCKFWSLDQDHDLLISKEDLAKHNDASISSRIIDRIFMGIVSKQIQLTGKMSYTDFVWFLIAEEDKKHPRSIEYWFRLMDLDGDGYISMYEMEYFYYEQMKRLELMNIEALPFLDSACQILDLVNPKEKNKISLSDLKRTKLSTIFFDTFINLEKYLEHESREFVSSRDIIQDGVVISDWDHYASEEYESLVSEESNV